MPPSTHPLLPLLMAFMAAMMVSSCCPCVPTDAKCQERRECSREGHCTVRMHHAGDWYYACYAATEEDCQQSKICKEGGKCHPSEMGSCVRKEDLDKHLCKDSWRCRHNGSCASLDGACIATKPEHCERSYRCKTEGRCAQVDMICEVTTDEHCRQSTGCEIAGLCKIDWRLGINFGCSLTKDEDACQDSLVCQDYDRCHRRPNRQCDQSGEKGCGLYYCGPAEDEPGVTPCFKRTHIPEAREACEPHGRCILNEDDQCVPLP